MDEKGGQTVRQLRNVRLGVCAGIIVFLAIAIPMQGLLPPSQLAEDLAMGMLLLFVAGSGMAWAVVDRGAVARVRRIRQEIPQHSDAPLLAAYPHLLIASTGLIQASCLLACLRYMRTRTQIAVAFYGSPGTMATS